MRSETKLLEIAKNFFEVEDISLDTPREEVEAWDSLAHVMLIAAVAEELGIRAPIEEFGNIKCLRDILQYEQ